MKKLIFYDLDGTLADTREDIAAAANWMRGQKGLPPLEAGEIAGYVGKGLHHLVRQCLGTEDPKQVEKGAALYREHYGKHMLDHSRLYPGAREFLEYFKSRKQAVISNKPDPYATKLLEALGVLSYFAFVIPGDSAYPKKPNPASLLDIMKKTGIVPAETLFVGDSLVDIETAQNAGIKTAVLTHGFTPLDELKCHSPQILADGFEALLQIARHRGW